MPDELQCIEWLQCIVQPMPSTEHTPPHLRQLIVCSTGWDDDDGGAATAAVGLASTCQHLQIAVNCALWLFLPPSAQWLLSLSRARTVHSIHLSDWKLAETAEFVCLTRCDFDNEPTGSDDYH